MPVGFALGLPVNEPRKFFFAQAGLNWVLAGTLDNTYLRFTVSKHKTPTPLPANCFLLASPAFHSLSTAHSVTAIIHCRGLRSDAHHFLTGLWQWPPASKFVYSMPTNRPPAPAKMFLSEPDPSCCCVGSFTRLLDFGPLPPVNLTWHQPLLAPAELLAVPMLTSKLTYMLLSVVLSPFCAKDPLPVCGSL